MTITTDTITLPVAGSTMGAYVARPDTGLSPALMILQEAFGVNDNIKDITRRFAQQGYVAIAPELFHRTAPQGFTAGYDDFASVGPHLQGATTDGIIEDVRAVHEWMLGDRQVDAGRIGSVGFCLGGRATFIANSVIPLKAGVSFYGGGIAQNLLHLAPEERAPMLFFWGGLDKHIGPEHRTAVAEAMTAAGKPYVNVEFSNADHGFFNDEKPAFNANAARQAWPLMLSFLATYLKS